MQLLLYLKAYKLALKTRRRTVILSDPFSILATSHKFLDLSSPIPLLLDRFGHFPRKQAPRNALNRLEPRLAAPVLAGRKVNIWALRQHPKVMSLKFKSTVKKQERINARVRYIEGDITDVERKGWESQFEAVPEPLTEAEKKAFNVQSKIRVNKGEVKQSEGGKEKRKRRQEG